MRLAIGLLTCCVLLAGCDGNRVATLEKENKDLKTNAKKQNPGLVYDLQSKCSKEAHAWFVENWSRDKNTIFLEFTNHYDAKLNKCFILVEYHYKSDFAGPGGSSWTNEMILTDVQQNAKLAYFAENHITNLKPQLNTHEELISCSVLSKGCKTSDEFDNFVGQYMAD